MVVNPEVVDMTEQHERGLRGFGARQQRAEVSVAGHDDTMLVGDALQDHRIACVSKSDIEHVHRVVAGLDQRLGDARRQVRVKQQPHAAGTGSSRSDTAAAAYSKAASTSARSRYG